MKVEVKESNETRKQLLEVASNELAQAQDQMLLLGRKMAQGKEVSFLLLLSKRSHARGAPASPISLPMSRADIADYLGLTTETVSRTVTSLKGSDAILNLREPLELGFSVRSDHLKTLLC